MNVAVVMHFAIEPDQLDATVRDARAGIVAGRIHDQVGLRGVFLAIEDDADVIVAMFNP